LGQQCALGRMLFAHTSVSVKRTYVSSNNMPLCRPFQHRYHPEFRHTILKAL
jgi:hypothetical protein